MTLNRDSVRILKSRSGLDQYLMLLYNLIALNITDSITDHIKINTL